MIKFVLLFILLCGVAAAQNTGEIVTLIKDKTKQIYEDFDTQEFFMSSKTFHEGYNSCGSDLVVYLRDGNLTRAVVKNFVPEGFRAIEYYLENKSPIFIYETFEFFSETKPNSAELNFKGLPFWEKRIYLEKGEIVETILKGTKDTIPDFNVVSYLEEISEIKKHVGL